MFLLGKNTALSALRHIALALTLLALATTQATAQQYPDYSSITVNDFADLLDEAAQSRLDAQLNELRRDTGIEMTLVTLQSQQPWRPDMELEPFATGLFDHWGIGDKTRNDGILVLVLRADRAMRIELGAAYGRDWDRAAARVIDRSFLPAFREDRYQDGIEAGVSDTIDTIARPFLAGEDAPKGGGDTPWLFITGVIAAIIAVIFRQPLGDQFARLRRCPNCGARSLSRTRKVLTKSSRKAKGSGERTTRCSNCDYINRTPYTIPRLSSGSSSSFGGGSSGGGGASGRW